ESHAGLPGRDHRQHRQSVCARPLQRSRAKVAASTPERHEGHRKARNWETTSKGRPSTSLRSTGFLVNTCRECHREATSFIAPCAGGADASTLRSLHRFEVLTRSWDQPEVDHGVRAAGPFSWRPSNAYIVLGVAEAISGRGSCPGW